MDSKVVKFWLCLLVTALTLVCPPSTFAEPYSNLTCSNSTNVAASAEQIEREFSATRHELVESPKAAERFGRKLIHEMVGDDIAAYLSVSPDITVIRASQPAALAAANRLVISTGLLELTDSAAEVSFVLAHELGHLSLHHSGSYFMGERDQIQTQLKNELDADQFAVKLLKEAGLDPRAGITILARLSRLGVDHGVQVRNLFPSISGRIQALERQLNR